MEEVNAVETRSTGSRPERAESSRPASQRGEQKGQPGEQRRGRGRGGRGRSSGAPACQTLYELLFESIQNVKTSIPNEALMRELNLEMDQSISPTTTSSPTTQLGAHP